jgi:polysaccharide biosynthesis/export protein
MNYAYYYRGVVLILYDPQLTTTGKLGRKQIITMKSIMKLVIKAFCLFIVLSFYSCRTVTSSFMFKTPKDFAYNDLLDTTKEKEYIISYNDVLDFRIYSNDGFKLIDITASGSINQSSISGIVEAVDNDGMIKLPIEGKIFLLGKTLREAEKQLEEIYSKIYVKPYVTLKVINKRVMVFPGRAGDARVVTLSNNNTTLIEALALAGGISDDGKAYKVKLIRNKDNQPKVYLLDLSKIENVKLGQLKVQTNDIIYVEPRKKYATKILAEISPYLALLSTSLVFYTIFR